MSALMESWLTPTSLFIVLNVVIGAIFLISSLSPPKTPNLHQKFEHDGCYNSAPPVLLRAPSLLERVKSLNFSTYRFPLPNEDIDYLQPNNLAAHPLERAPSILERAKSIKLSLHKLISQNPSPDDIQPTEQDYTNPQPLSRSPSLLERIKSIDFTTFHRSDSIKTNQPTTEEADSDADKSPVHGQVKRCKSESSKVIPRKSPEKIKKSASETSSHKAEEEDQEDEDQDGQAVDAKADDFIHKFKQRLKLERWDSFLRYRNMLKGKMT